ALQQQGAREAARARPDLDDGALVERLGSARDAPRQVEVEQEVLAEPLAGIEAVTGDGLAQRRQRRHARSHLIHAQVLRRRAMSSAMAIAAIRLAGSARPVPAMSRAVP